MAKIGVDLSFTFRVGATSLNQFSKINLSVTEIDTDIPLEVQLEKVRDYQSQLWKFMQASIDSKMSEILDT